MDELNHSARCTSTARKAVCTVPSKCRSISRTRGASSTVLTGSDRAQGPPEEFELPEDMQLDGDGGAGQEDSGSDDGQQEGMEADAAEDGGPLPEQDAQERQPQPEADEAKGGSFAVLQSYTCTRVT